MTDNLRQQLLLLPQYLGAHILVSTAALAMGLSLSLPLGVVAARSAWLSGFVMSVAGVVQTIPGLALLALMVPLLGAFGFWPTLSALTLYSMLPVLRNTVTALMNLDSAVLEAARGVGMTPRQVLCKVELPLALPMIVAGARTAAVWVVGMATLSTPVGQAGLGNYIFSGLQTRNWTAVLVGCIGSATLALCIDGLLALIERGLSQRRRRLWLSACGGLAMLLGAGTSNRWLASSATSASPAPVATSAAPAPESHPAQVPPATLDRPLRIGAKTFTEQYILAHLMELRANAAGLATERVESLGSTVAFDALRSGQIDMYVDYTGTIYANYMKRDEVRPSWQVMAITGAWLAAEHGIRQLGALGFENAYAIAIRRETAARLPHPTISELAKLSKMMRLGGDYEFFQRPEWARLEQTYGLTFSKLVTFDSTFMYPAVRDGEVSAIAAFSSDGRIAAYDLVVLEDPEGGLPPYDAVLLLAPTLAANAAVVAALEPLIGAIEVSLMREANWQVDRDADRRSVDQAARWLEAQIRGRRSGAPPGQHR